MIKIKRDSLERFIRAQMQGPGACNNRFCFIDEHADIIDVINTTPGSLYSTAILFPKRTSNDNFVTIPSEEDENQNLVALLDGSDSLETHEESDQDNDINEKTPMLSQAEEDDLYSLSQRFPNTIGISCCLNAEDSDIDSRDIKITISGRYYRKISKSESGNIVVLIQENYPEFEEFYNLYKDRLSTHFVLLSNGLCSATNFTKEYFDVKRNLLDINIELCSKVAKNPNGEFDQTYLAIGSNYRYLKSYKERLWSKLKRIDYDHLTYLSDSEKEKTIAQIRKIELYETFLS